MACRKYVNKLVFYCKHYTQRLVEKCVEWADERSRECTEWKDEGYRECERWADEGSYECCDWAPCSWFCDLVYWVAKWVCKGWKWVANLVCQGWAWVVKAVCQVTGFFIEVFCSLVGVALEIICVAWDFISCRFRKQNKGKIKHVFVLTLENRSFDHMLGFSKIDGIDAITKAPTSLRGVNPAIHFNVDPDDPSVGRVIPQPGAEYKIPATGSDVHREDPGHEFNDTLIQMCGKGAEYTPSSGYPPVDNSGYFYSHKEGGSDRPRRVMDCFSPGQLPILNTLAKEFAVCDNWFCSMPGPTWPNRFFIHAASSAGLDDSPENFDVAIGVAVDGYRFQNGHIFDKLQDRCHQWSVFEGDEFPITFALGGMNLDVYRQRFVDMDDFEATINSNDYKDTYAFIEPHYGNVLTGRRDFICGNSMHPLDDVTRGERLIKRVYEAIRKSPLWEKSALIITFDEHGGFYDHVVPPAAVPPGDRILAENNFHDFKFDQLGPRVPALVISPLIPKGTIDHTQYDHTSLLATLQKIAGLQPMTDRDRNANNFMHLFSLDRPRTDAIETLPEVPESGWVCKDWFTGATEQIAEMFQKNQNKKEANKARRSIKAEKLRRLKEDLYVQLADHHNALREGKDHELLTSRPTSMQRGFAYVALLKALATSRYREQVTWIKNYKRAITNLYDYRQFILEAKLKTRFNIDVNKHKKP